MITSIARQSVIIKCNMQKSVLTGNYEFYYAAGLVEKLFGISVDENSKPEDLKTFLMEQIETLEAGDEKEAYLLDMIKGYRPEENYDIEMQELLLWGKKEQYLWTVTLPADA